MGCEVYANTDEIACKAGANKVIAAMPDVCLSPPSPPAGPVPVPYPNTSFSKDIQDGSKTVLIKGEEVMLKDQTFHKTSPLGDEAATNGLGAGVITHVITGKTYCVSWSMDVKFEGQNVDRHTDLTTSNHASPAPNRAAPLVQSASTAPTNLTQCPCCKDTPAHANQQGPVQEVTEDEYYGVDPVTEAGLKKGMRDTQAQAINPSTKKKQEAAVLDRQVALEDRKEKLEKGRKMGCQSLPDKGDCGKYYVGADPAGVETERKNFQRAGGYKDDFDTHRQGMGGPPLARGETVNHRVPLAAGGCPKSPDNLVADSDMSSDCVKWDHGPPPDGELNNLQATVRNSHLAGGF